MKIKIDVDIKGALKALKNDAKKAIEDSEVALPCKCGHKIRKSLRWLNSNKNLICPSCRATFDNKELGKVIESLGK